MTRKDVHELFGKQNGQCAICGTAIGLGYNQSHFDHVFPTAKGGCSCIENLQITCPFCNMRKNDKVDPTHIRAISCSADCTNRPKEKF